MRTKSASWLILLLPGLALVALADDGPKQPGGGDSRPPERLAIPGIENAFRLSPRLYSGGDPHGVEALTALRELGIKTIISVDGVTPDVEVARRLGIRYVHLPIGYDGVPRSQAVRMVKALKTLPGPVFVHCHHGIHRGPASAAICGMASEGWDKGRAAGWLKIAGTSADYRGLHASVRDFVPPTAGELDAVGDELPESSEVPALVELMVKVDERWDTLKAIQKSGFGPIATRPGIDPTAEALQLLELFRESSRLPEAREKGSGFSVELAAAEKFASGLYDSMAKSEKPFSPGTLKDLEAAFASLGKSCKSCHVLHRDAK